MKAVLPRTLIYRGKGDREYLDFGSISFASDICGGAQG